MIGPYITRLKMQIPWWKDENVTLYITTVLGCYMIFHFLNKVVSDIILTLIFGTDYNALSSMQRCRTKSGFVSAVHSAVTFVIALYGLLILNLPWDKCLYDSLFARLLACMEIAYYLQDTYLMCTGKFSEDGICAFFVHHLCVLIGTSMTIICKAFAFFFCLRAINDFSVPFQNIRIILSNLNRKKTTAYTINAVLFLITYSIARVLVIPITFTLIFGVLYTEDWASIPTISKIIFLGFAVITDFLNLYWFRLLLRGAYRVLILKKD